MNAGIYSAASGGVSAMLRLEAIADNLANASTVGFKAERFVQRAAAPSRAGTTQTAVPTPINRAHLETDFSQGSITRTGNSLDVAITGPGFFVVDGKQGERLTRRGNFSLDAEGHLTSGGLRVQGDGGQIVIGPGSVEIADDGTVRNDGNIVGKLRVVAVPDQSGLKREGGTLFALGNQTPAEPLPGAVSLTQGAIEGANVSPVESLVGLIDTMRGYEAYMHAAQQLDEIETRTITDVGRV